jgi:hypothetical protein
LVLGPDAKIAATVKMTPRTMGSRRRLANPET